MKKINSKLAVIGLGLFSWGERCGVNHVRSVSNAYNLELVGQVGISDPVLTLRDYAYVSMGPEFTVLEITNPNESPLTDFAFNAPVIVTSHCSDRDWRLISAESVLELKWWTGSEWQDASSTCDPMAP